MQTRRILLSTLTLVLLACQALAAATPRNLDYTSTPGPALTTTPRSTPSHTPLPSRPTPLPTATPPVIALTVSPYLVRVHPDGGIFTGDQVSFELIAPPGDATSPLSVQVSLADEPGKILATSEFGWYGLANRRQATLPWAWDTRGLPAGIHQMHFSILPGGPEWDLPIEILPAAQLPAPEPKAAWSQAESECCIIHYITGTEAERDISAILKMADQQAADVTRKMGAEFTQPVPVVILSRVLGHGGFTSQEIAISYLDRNYAGGSQDIVLHHEMVHLLDASLGGELRPSILVEGLAVYLTGGHFKLEELPPRAAALQQLGRYLPLASLADRFYPSQHEAGYIQAGALVEFMVSRWGWDAFLAFYRDIHPAPDNGGQSAAISAALHKHFGLTLSILETGYIGWLNDQTVTPETLEDVRLTIEFYDTLRRYQELLDPSAHYLTAWLPDGVRMREMGIVADFLRRPNNPLNPELETLLVNANARLVAGDHAAAAKLIETINTALDLVSAGLLAGE